MSGRQSKFVLIAALCALASGLYLDLSLPPALAAAPRAKDADKTEAKSALKDVFVAHQTSKAFGKCDLYLTPDAGRFYGRGGDIIIMSKAPSWHIIMYNKAKNMGYEFTQADAEQSKLGVFTSPLGMTGTPLAKYKDPDLHVEAGRVVIAGGAHHIQHDAFIFQDRKKRDIKDTTTEVYQPCVMIKPLQRFVNWIYSFGTYPGIPLDLTAHYVDGSVENLYHTVAIEHVRKPDVFFDYVTNFKKVPNVLKVLVSEDVNTTLEDLLGDTPSKSK